MSDKKVAQFKWNDFIAYAEYEISLLNRNRETNHKNLVFAVQIVNLKYI